MSKPKYALPVPAKTKAVINTFTPTHRQREKREERDRHTDRPGQTDRMDRQTDRRMDGQMDGRAGGWMAEGADRRQDCQNTGREMFPLVQQTQMTRRQRP